MADAADDHRRTPQPDGPDFAAEEYRSIPGRRETPAFADVAVVCDTVTRLTGVDGAAVAVFAPSRSRELVYATDALAQQIDDLQFTLGEGPCLDAYRQAKPMLCPHIDHGEPFDRWPAFCIAAGDATVVESGAVDSLEAQAGDTFSRAGVYIAAGMVAVQLGVSADEGLDRLRAYSYARSVALNAVAADIVARRLTLRPSRDDHEDS